jgi:hypothetical protein
LRRKHRQKTRANATGVRIRRVPFSPDRVKGMLI